MTLEQVGAEVGLTHGNLSRIERGERPYNQGLLESLSRLYGTDPASLLARNPNDPEGIWSIWDRIPDRARPLASKVLGAFAAKPDPGNGTPEANTTPAKRGANVIRFRPKDRPKPRR